MGRASRTYTLQVQPCIGLAPRIGIWSCYTPTPLVTVTCTLSIHLLIRQHKRYSVLPTGDGIVIHERDHVRTQLVTPQEGSVHLSGTGLLLSTRVLWVEDSTDGVWQAALPPL